MKVLNKFTIKSLTLNKKRTIVTIIGIMLSTALICGVTGLVSSAIKTLKNIEIKAEGNYHATFHNVSPDKAQYITYNDKIKDYFTTNTLGWAKLEGNQDEYKPYILIKEYDEKALKNYGVELAEGRLPENSTEIIIPKRIRTTAKVNLKIGDKITLEVGDRALQDGYILDESNPYLTGAEDQGIILEESIINSQIKTYTVVGIMDDSYYAEAGYGAITYKENNNTVTNISVLYKNPREYEEVNKEILKNTEISEEDIYLNSSLLRLEGVMGDDMLSVLYSLAGIIIFIIVISSVFVIRNSFSISVQERNKQYGMLASVGATSKQIRKSVLFEGFIIGIIAIPLGILLGIVTIMILLQVVNYLLLDLFQGEQFIYDLHPVGVIVAVVVSLITIYLSCLIPAIKAAKISPIESIRGNKDVKIKSKKLRTMRLTKKIFGIGGVIASKNLKRSKKKYRTTVISIVVSLFTFISLSTFIEYGNKMTNLYYIDCDYNLYVWGSTEKAYQEITKLDNINKYAYYYNTALDANTDKYVSEEGKQYLPQGNNIINVYAYNNEYFKEYIKELGLKEGDYKTAVILIDEVVETTDTNKKIINLYNLKAGDELIASKSGENKNIKIAKKTNKNPMGLEGMNNYSGMFIVSQDFIKEVFNEKIDDSYHLGALFINTDKSDEVESSINDLIKDDEIEYAGAQVNNVSTLVRQQKRLVLVVAIFLYGFITVITLIGVTNIFNTITTNMILRSKEFAMLKSIGMTKKEFNRMIRLESIMYGLKSLIIGIPLGILGSYGIYHAFINGIEMGYKLPIMPIIIATIFVFVIISITMRYSLSKINKQNIIETIRNDNI